MNPPAAEHTDSASTTTATWLRLRVVGVSAPRMVGAMLRLGFPSPAFAAGDAILYGADGQVADMAVRRLPAVIRKLLDKPDAKVEIEVVQPDESLYLDVAELTADCFPPERAEPAREPVQAAVPAQQPVAELVQTAPVVRADPAAPEVKQVVPPVPQADRHEIARALALLHGDDAVVELRAIKAGSPAEARCYGPDERQALIDRAVDLNARGRQCYVQLNVVDEALAGAPRACKDEDIVRRRWLLIDLDPRRQTGVGSTDEQLAAAVILGIRICDAMRERGWPDPVVAESGNGAHLLYAVDLANDSDARELVRTVLCWFASEFGTADIDVDVSVSNAARITKLYGTASAKGPHTAETPHRLSRITKAPNRREVVTEDHLRAVVAEMSHRKDAAATKAQTNRAAASRGGNAQSGPMDPEILAVIDAFNAAYPVEELLARHGYVDQGANRWLAPGSTSGIAGVVILEGKAWSHHSPESDPLADGRPHSAWDLYLMFDHRGDWRAALRAARMDPRVMVPELPPQMDIAAAERAQAERTTAGEAEALIANSERRQAKPVVDAETDENVQPAEPPTPAEQAEAEARAILAEREAESLIAAPVMDEVSYEDWLLSPPGMVGEVARWVLDTSMYPQPILAVAAALGAVGAALGRKVMGPRKERTNLYLVGVAQTGHGKDYPKQCFSELFRAAGIDRYLGADRIASEQGLYSAAAASPNVVFLLDEIGDFMQTVEGKNAPPHLVGVQTGLKQLFSGTKTTFRGTAYSDRKSRPPTVIPYPCVGLYCVGVPEKFYAGVTHEMVDDGLYNRLLIVSASESKPEQNSDEVESDPPQQIVDWFKATGHILVPGSVPESGENPVRVRFGERAKGVIDRFEERVAAHVEKLRRSVTGEMLAKVWARAGEHATKIALVVACGMKTDHAVIAEAGRNGCFEIDAVSADWATRFVWTTLEYMEKAAATRIGSSDHERDCQATLRVIERAGLAGLSESELIRACRPFRKHKPRDQDMIIESLRRSRDVVVRSGEMGGNGKPKASRLVAVSAYGHHKK